ncbi:MAG: PAC2 family protein [Nanoarchaeota archaeon]|nr:PAC2 family protein [Nanoarchaeota archaeon]
METWKAIPLTKTLPKLKNPILVEGLPGIGNVGKVAVDFIIEELKAKKLYSLFSYTLPHSVFVNEENLVELPSIEMYYKERKGKPDLLFLTGDVQPIDEKSSYAFCDKILEIMAELSGKEIITTGGIGLQEIPENPRIFITGNDQKTIKKYAQGVQVEKKIHGVVGPIIGVTGLLLGLGKPKGINGISLLAETFGHPMYLGIKGAKAMLRILNKKLSLNIDLNKLTKEIEKLERETIKRTKELSTVTKQLSKRKVETSYIG